MLQEVAADVCPSHLDRGSLVLTSSLTQSARRLCRLLYCLPRPPEQLGAVNSKLAAYPVGNGNLRLRNGVP